MQLNTDISDPRTMECDEWASKEKQRIQAQQRNAGVWLITIRLRQELRDRGAKLVGKIWMPSGAYLDPHPAWHYHCAVLFEGIVRDELHPNGLPLEAYKRIFPFSDDLEFVPEDGVFI
ncbi:hypothetical protein AWB81_07224 [Caballeronia arationis]|uniref:hypothetical protein n=1 Tax=Caballeronia arationis TaxID=1777142 RepID=UPI00074BFED4|nr:hypothetical protein [Caballeronia arationis]SAL05592.1 hypothetical protein AWB81_07224 [Caballeronia arationis]